MSKRFKPLVTTAKAMSSSLVCFFYDYCGLIFRVHANSMTNNTVLKYFCASFGSVLVVIGSFLKVVPVFVGGCCRSVFTK